jgi:hypothetical protein
MAEFFIDTSFCTIKYLNICVIFFAIWQTKLAVLAKIEITAQVLFLSRHKYLEMVVVSLRLLFLY